MAQSLDLSNGWSIRDSAPPVGQDEVRKATIFALANGYMSARGSADDAPLDRPGVVGHHVNGLYDTPTGGILDREMINLPAWTSLHLAADGQPLRLDEADSYARTLDLRRGLLQQTAHWTARGGNRVTLRSERLVSLDRPHLGAIRWQIEASAACDLTIRSAVDANITNRFAVAHFAAVQPEAAPGACTVAARTIDPGYDLVVMAAHELGRPPDVVRAGQGRAEQVYHARIVAGTPLVFTKFAAVYDSRFASGDLAALCSAELDEALSAGYEAIRAAHVDRWAALWDASDLVIDGDDQAQLAIRFCLFHLLANSPHSDRVSISARGLQGQDYWGSIFWDYEIYVLPFFIYTQPASARRSLIYRYHTLDGARRKARALGFAGAYYAWQSQETGDETCALYVFDDPRTGQKIRSYFADEQIHISADIAFAIDQYVRATGDTTFLAEYGLEVACEVARFFASRVTGSGNRYELRTVLGPDEYHERVDNNAYTNTLARESLAIALAALDRVRASDLAAARRLAAKIGLGDGEIARWRDVAERLFVPEPDPASGLIAQFDGYFELEDAAPDAVRARLEHPDQYPGGLTGPYQTTQAIKQADVVLLLYLLRDRYSRAAKTANWAYYEPRTAHDSSLSPMAYALVAADVGMTGWAHTYFMQTALLDLLGTGPHWNLGVHTAAMGGAWLAVVHGFCQLDLREDGVHLLGWPHLPAGWRRVGFRVVWHGQRVGFSTDGVTTTLETLDGPVPATYPGGVATLMPGQPLCLRGDAPPAQ